MDKKSLMILKIVGFAMAGAASIISAVAKDKQQSEETKKAINEYLSNMTFVKKD